MTHKYKSITMIPESQTDSEDLFDSCTNKTYLTDISTRCTTGTGYSRTKKIKLHQCTEKCTHDAQTEFDSSETEDEFQEKNVDISVKTMPDETKNVNNKSSVHYHFGNIVAEEIKKLPPSKKFKLMAEILKVIENFQTD
ncbi:hypothetical protein evm_010463 [Chilo suppressalis]|nr:hypothetical protein evm_010463 [Chilo suppressalis]